MKIEEVVVTAINEGNVTHKLTCPIGDFPTDVVLNENSVLTGFACTCSISGIPFLHVDPILTADGIIEPERRVYKYTNYSRIDLAQATADLIVEGTKMLSAKKP